MAVLKPLMQLLAIRTCNRARDDAYFAVDRVLIGARLKETRGLGGFADGCFARICGGIRVGGDLGE